MFLYGPPGFFLGGKFVRKIAISGDFGDCKAIFLKPQLEPGSRPDRNQKPDVTRWDQVVTGGTCLHQWGRNSSDRGVKPPVS